MATYLYDDFIGKTVVAIRNYGNDELFFATSDGQVFKMWHEQECCEYVSLEEVIGDLDDLIGSPITMAEEVCESREDEDWNSQTWTFYKFATNKGYVTLRWFVASNGYYSESVTFCRYAEPWFHDEQDEARLYHSMLLEDSEGIN